MVSRWHDLLGVFVVYYLANQIFVELSFSNSLPIF